MTDVLAPSVAPVGVTGGAALVAALEAVYEALRTDHGELPDVVVVTGSGRTPGGLNWGHCAPDRWADALSGGRRPELFVGGEALSQGAAFVLHVVLHEAAHVLGAARGVKDCSGQSNRYHNGEFRKLGEELGLVYPGSEAHPTRGYTDMVVTEATSERYAQVVDALALALAFHIEPPADVESVPGGDGGKVPPTTGGDDGAKPPSRNNMKFECSCDPPRIMRMAPKTWEIADVVCGECDDRFQ